MTETVTTEKRDHVVEAVDLIDRGLGDLAERNLFTADEVTDLLLDLRRILTQPSEVSPN